MPFDKANPSDSEKIRRLGIVIRPNWKAIEQGSQDDDDASKLKYWAVNLYSRDRIPGAPGNDAPELTQGLALFSKYDSQSQLAELFYRSENNSVVQLTKYIPNIAPIGYANNGETFLPGGLLLKYAIISSKPSGTAAFTWAGTGANQFGLSAFPNNCFNVQATMLGVQALFTLSAVTKTGFTITQTGLTASYYVLAIGN